MKNYSQGITLVASTQKQAVSKDNSKTSQHISSIIDHLSPESSSYSEINGREGIPAQWNAISEIHLENGEAGKRELGTIKLEEREDSYRIVYEEERRFGDDIYRSMNFDSFSEALNYIASLEEDY